MKRIVRPISQDDLLDLIGCIYDAAGDASLWNVFLTKFSDVIRGTTTTMVVFDEQQASRNVATAIRADRESQRKYEEHYSKIDSWFNNGKHLLTTGNVVTGQMLCPDEALEKTEFYNDFLQPLDNFHEVCGVISNDRSVMSMITCMRPKRSGPFGLEETRLVQTLIPHLQRAVQLHRRFVTLEGRAASGADALDFIGVGVVMTDTAGKILTMNQAAQTIVAAKDGLNVVRQGLCAESSTEAQRLRELIRGAGLIAMKQKSLRSGGVMTVSRPSLRRAFEVLVAPLPSNYQPMTDQPAVLIFITDTELRAKPPERMLAQLYGLTEAESRLASSLMQGKSLSQAEEDFSVTRNTVHSQLKTIFQKTGTNRQTELMRVLLKGLGQLRPSPRL